MWENSIENIQALIHLKSKVLLMYRKSQHALVPKSDADADADAADDGPFLAVGYNTRVWGRFSAGARCAAVAQPHQPLTTARRSPIKAPPKHTNMPATGNARPGSCFPPCCQNVQFTPPHPRTCPMKSPQASPPPQRPQAKAAN